MKRLTPSPVRRLLTGIISTAVATMAVLEPNTRGAGKPSFVLPVNVDNLPIWKTHGHLCNGGVKKLEIVGHISLGSLVYTPIQ